jgi:hypothetical protein
LPASGSLWGKWSTSVESLVNGLNRAYDFYHYFLVAARTSPHLQEVAPPPSFGMLQALFWPLADIRFDAGAHDGPEAFLA